MEIWFWGIGGLVLGLLLGFGLSVVIKRKKPVGTLRVDRSDPEEAPYLFLELERDGMDKIHKAKTVVFKVDLSSYLARN